MKISGTMLGVLYTLLLGSVAGALIAVYVDMTTHSTVCTTVKYNKNVTSTVCTPVNIDADVNASRPSAKPAPEVMI